MGWPGLTHQSRSSSPASRHLRPQPVPMSLRKILEKWPEWSTTRPMPSEHPLVDAVDDLVVDFFVSGVPPPGEDIGGVEHVLRQAVLGFVEGGGADGRGVAEVLFDARLHHDVHAIGVDVADGVALVFVAVLVPDGDAEGTTRGGGSGHGEEV